MARSAAVAAAARPVSPPRVPDPLRPALDLRDASDGSICVGGVSLASAVGARVHLEVDVLAECVENILILTGKAIS